MNAASPRHISGLDGLRAIAAVAVVFYHVQFLAPSASGPVADAAAPGWVGVDLFFAISGFILFLPFARAAADGRSLDVGQFFARRMRRILPGFWFNLAVLVTLVTPALMLTADGWATILANATFTADYLGLPSVNSVYWSLYCEMAFYVFLPLVAPAFTGDRWTVSLPVAIVVAWVFRFAVVTNLPGQDDYFRVIMQFPGVLDQFAFGMAAGAVWARWEARPERVPLALTRTMAVAGTVLVLAVAWTIQRGIGLAEFWTPQTGLDRLALATLRPWLSAGFALVILGVCFHPSWLRTALELRPVRYVGAVSYGLYLWHLPVIKALAEEVGGPGRSSVIYLTATLAVLVLALGWAAFSHRFVELPFTTVRTRAAVPDRQT